MSERPTPETDALASEHRGAVIWPDFARKLERERDEAQDTICDVLKALDAMEYEGPRLAALRVKSERDEARSDLEFRRGLFQLQEQQLNEVRVERDALQEQLDAAIMLGKMQERRHARELEQVREQYRLSSVCRKLMIENQKLKGDP